MKSSILEQYEFLKREKKFVFNFLCIIGVFIGFPCLYPYSIALSELIGINYNECIRCQEGSTLWMILFIVGIPALVYGGVLISFFIYGVILYKKGAISSTECKRLVLFREYPSSWLST